jgi:TusA-related sulfurtransferase
MDSTVNIIQVDARGEVCPTPLMMATKAMKAAAPGDVVQVLIDYAPSLDTVPPQARRLGWQVEVEETGAPEWTITLRR